MPTFMDNALYKASVDGKFEAFGDYEGRLDYLVTPNKNTVLHVYLANKRIKLKFIYIGCAYCFFPNSLASELIKSSRFVEQILKKCPSLPLKANAKGETPLHIEAKYGNSSIARLLLQHAKAYQDHRDLVENGVEPAKQMLRAVDNEENTALHVAARYGHLEMVRVLIQEDPDFEYLANTRGETPLFIAARRGYHGLVTEVLDKCKYVAAGGPDGTNALHAAVMARCEKTVEVVLKNKMNLAKEADQNKRTPLHYAAHLDLRLIVKLLLECDKSAAYVRDKQEMTALLMAARQGHALTMKEIINHCPDCCELVGRRKWNFLHFAAVSLPDKPLIEFLRAEEFRHFIDDQDSCGNTPLHVLVSCRYIFKFPARHLKHDVGVLHDMPLISVPWPALTNARALQRKDEIFEFLEDICNGEVAGVPIHPPRKYKTDLARLDNAMQNQSVVATLIASVSFAAAFAVPGGYQSEKGRDQGTAILSGDPTFIAFMMADAIAVGSSLLALTISYFGSWALNDGNRSVWPYFFSLLLIQLSIGALVIAFIFGTYTILKPSMGLAIVICFIALSFIPLGIWLGQLVVKYSY